MTERHPVAASCEDALRTPIGWGVRERDAAAAAGGPVVFVTELHGAAFVTRDAALEAWPDALAQAWCALRPVAPDGARPAPPAVATCRDGARWPAPSPAPPTLWRLAVSYWRPKPATGVEVGARPGSTLDPALPAARTARRDRTSVDRFAAADLGRLARQPLRAVRPQQPLDVGLFEVRLPESPGLLVADE